MRGGREGGEGRKQARKEEAGRMDGRREAGRQGARVGWMGGAIAPPVCDEWLLARQQKPDRPRECGCVLKWVPVGLQMWCVAVGFAPRTSDGSSLLHRARVIVRLSGAVLSSPVYASPIYAPKSRARTCPTDLGVFRRHQGKHGPTPPTSRGRTAPRPNSGNLAAQQGGQGKKKSLLLTCTPPPNS